MLILLIVEKSAPDKYGPTLLCDIFFVPKDQDQLCVTSSKCRICLSIQCTTMLSRGTVLSSLIICKQSWTFVLHSYKYLWREHKSALSDTSLLCSAISKYDSSEKSFRRVLIVL